MILLSSKKTPKCDELMKHTEIEIFIALPLLLYDTPNQSLIIVPFKICIIHYPI